MSKIVQISGPSEFERDGSPLRLAHKKKDLPPSSEEDIAVSNNSLLERVVAVAEDLHFTKLSRPRFSSLFIQ